MSEGAVLGPGGTVRVAYVILRRGSQVLLQFRRGTGYMDGCWSVAAAGRLDGGESAREAAIREAREEIGVSIAPEKLVQLPTTHPTGEPRPGAESREDFFFVVDSWIGEPAVMEPGKAAALAWFEVDALPTPLVPHEAAVLRRLGAIP